MKAETITSQENLELDGQIYNFQTMIQREISLFRKRIIEPGEVQFYPKDIVGLSREELIENNQEHLTFRSMEIQYNQCVNLGLPLPLTKVFRFIHLRSFAHILESLINACERKNPIEICFHLRNYLEYSASYSYALNEIIPICNQFLKNMKIESETNMYNSNLIEKIPSDVFRQLSVKLYKLLLIYCNQTNVTKKSIDEFDGNDSIVPDKIYPLKSTQITKKLKAFERQVDLFHPSYDLLSEFLHPNSFTLFSSVDAPGKEESRLILKDLKLEDAIFSIDYFFSERNQLFLSNVSNEVIKRDSELLSIQAKITKKLKSPFRKILSFNKFNSNSLFKNKPCVCGSKKLLTSCCAK